MAVKTKTAWQKAVGAQLRQGHSFPVAVKRAKVAYRGSRKAKKNPWVSGYEYTAKARMGKQVSVPKYWRRKAGTKKVRTGMRYYNNPRKSRKTRRRVRRNPEFSYTLGPVQANPRRRKSKRPSRRGYRRNPEFTYTVGPVVANARGKRRGRRGYRRNPGISGFLNNPAAGVSSIKDFALQFTKSEFLVKNLLPVGAGVFGTKLIVAYAMPKISAKWTSITPKWRPAFEAGAGILGGFAVGMVSQNTAVGVKYATGGLIVALASLVEGTEFYKEKTKGLYGLGGLGVSAGAKSELQKAVQREIAKAEAAMEGVDEYASEDDEGVDGIDEYASEDEGLDGTGEYREADDTGVGLDSFMGAPRQAM